MTPRDMTTIHDPEAGTFGDCSRAVIASLLGLTCDEVPHFLADGTKDGNEFCRRINDWLRPRNLAFVMMPGFAHILDDIGVRGLHHEASGPSPRLPDYHHAVCGLDGVVTHDPHPSRAGIAVESWGVFIVLDPSKPTGQLPPLDDALRDILGRICFQCIPIAQALRAAGHEIKSRAEDEQAAAIHWMLGHYFTHGTAWKTAAGEDLRRMAAKAGEQVESPTTPQSADCPEVRS